MTDNRNEEMIVAPAQQQQPPRILARQMARELTTEELEQVSGGRMSRGGYTATSVCCDCDACDM